MAVPNLVLENLPMAIYTAALFTCYCPFNKKIPFQAVGDVEASLSLNDSVVGPRVAATPGRPLARRYSLTLALYTLTLALYRLYKLYTILFLLRSVHLLTLCHCLLLLMAGLLLLMAGLLLLMAGVMDACLLLLLLLCSNCLFVIHCAAGASLLAVLASSCAAGHLTVLASLCAAGHLTVLAGLCCVATDSLIMLASFSAAVTSHVAVLDTLDNLCAGVILVCWLPGVCAVLTAVVEELSSCC